MFISKELGVPNVIDAVGNGVVEQTLK